MGKLDGSLLSCSSEGKTRHTVFTSHPICLGVNVFRGFFRFLFYKCFAGFSPALSPRSGKVPGEQAALSAGPGQGEDVETVPVCPTEPVCVCAPHTGPHHAGACGARARTHTAHVCVHSGSRPHGKAAGRVLSSPHLTAQETEARGNAPGQRDPAVAASLTPPTGHQPCPDSTLWGLRAARALQGGTRLAETNPGISTILKFGSFSQTKQYFRMQLRRHSWGQGQVSAEAWGRGDHAQGHWAEVMGQAQSLGQGWSAEG